MRKFFAPRENFPLYDIRAPDVMYTLLSYSLETRPFVDCKLHVSHAPQYPNKCMNSFKEPKPQRSIGIFFSYHTLILIRGPCMHVGSPLDSLFTIKPSPWISMYSNTERFSCLSVAIDTVRVENFEVVLISRFSWVTDDTKIIHVEA